MHEMQEIVREWRILGAKLNLDNLLRDLTDEEAAARLNARSDLEERIAVCEIRTAHDAAAVLDVALSIIEEGGGRHDLELRMLKHLREGILFALPEVREAA